MVAGRYDILDGVRITTNPARRHQTIALNIAEVFKRYARAGKHARAYIAPVDVLISQVPLRTRQPDVLLISRDRRAQCGSDLDPAPLQLAPELVVAVLSASDYRGTRIAKLHDYTPAGVLEAWLVSPEAETVEVVSLSPEGMETRAVYAAAHTARSLVFPDLAAPVEELCADF